MRLPALVPLWAALAAAAAADSPVGVVDVHPVSEEVHTDGSDDLGFSAAASERGDAGVKRMWGVSDATAPVGHLFVHSIDKDAFHGTVKSFEVTGKTEQVPLPAWLTFDAGQRTFSGVPLPDELGPHLVTVRAHGRAGATAKDRFMVDVVHEGDWTTLNAVGGSHNSDELSCADSSASTVLAVYYDVTPRLLDGAERLHLLRSLAEAVHVEPELVRLSSHSGPLPLDDEHVLEAGPGASERRSPLQAVLTWRVGCSQQVHPERAASVAAVRGDWRLDDLTAAAGYPCVGWLMYYRPTPSRHRRQTDTDGSGDYYDYEDYEDYEDTFTDLNDTEYSHHFETPYQHVVPEEVTPAAEEAPPASPVYPPPRVTATPHRSRISTPIPTPVMPTLYYPDLESSRTPDEPAHNSAADTTSLQSSMWAAGGQPVATGRLPEHIAATPLVPALNTVHTVAVGGVNYPPHLQRRMRKLLLVAGKEFRERVPEEMFMDYEQAGGTRQLQLDLQKKSGHQLDPDGWIQFDAARQEIYGLPKEDDIGEYQFVLTARDNQGASTSDKVDAAVRQYRQWRAVNHRVFLEVEPASGDVPLTVDEELLLLHRVAAVFDQSDTTSILVYDLRAVQGNLVRLVWFNDTISVHRCDKLALSRMASRLVGKDGEPTAVLRKVLQPEFGKVRVRLELNHVCRGVHLSSLPPPTTDSPDTNHQPERRRQVDLIKANVGRLLHIQVPGDTFVDDEDGTTRDMELRLLTRDRQPVPAHNWLRFEPKNQEFIGLPMDADVGKSYYHLECIDSSGAKISDSFEVSVAARDESRDYNVEFSVMLDNNFVQFNRDPMQKKRLMEKLAVLMGDTSTTAMVVHDIRRGSVVFSWFNDTLETAACPDTEIEALRQQLLDNNSQVTERAAQALGPEFRLSGAVVTPRGLCLAENTPTAAAPPVAPDTDSLDEHAPQNKGDEYLVTFIIPAVVIAAMLLIAGVIACVLYRARRRGKMTMTDNGTYVSRGIPVIFSDELEDRMEKNAKPPVILTNERPPEPPVYPADGAPSPATPMLDERGEAASGGGEDAPYERPPPFAGVGESRAAGRTKPVPNYRQPPPYVPP